VRGYALPAPTNPSLFVEAKVADGIDSMEGDIRDRAGLYRALNDFEPEVVFHLAAQPLVSFGYNNPYDTFETNIMGTVSLMEAIRGSSSVRSVVNVTTDKCYENREWPWGYRETDPMGGYDPYSSSKGCAELVTSAYRQSYFEAGSVALASARAGNVIGGGDWAEDRLIPDIIRALGAGQGVTLRNPKATRPWQHVLEPLYGYILLAERLFEHGQQYADGWNFGPADQDVRSVEWVTTKLTKHFGGSSQNVAATDLRPHEAQCLKLDSSKAHQKLGWWPRWPLDEALIRVVNWQKAWLSGANIRDTCLVDIADYNVSGF
jgi:CDP-glucose 4,6-dehydratase